MPSEFDAFALGAPGAQDRGRRTEISFHGYGFQLRTLSRLAPLLAGRMLLILLSGPADQTITLP